MLALFYDRLFGQPLQLERAEIEAHWEITEDRGRFREADAVIFHVPELPRLFLRRKRPGQLWVAWSMESEAHYPRQVRASFMRHFDLTMTYRRDSDVFISYIPPALFREPAAEPPPKSSERLLCSFISGRHDRAGRTAYLRELGTHLDLHTYGRTGTRKLPNDRGRESKLEVIGNYKFTIAFENAMGEDYVSEKIYDPLIAGSVPVYRGAPNVSMYAPASDCYIDAEDFSGPAELAAHLLALDRDDGAYRKLLDWRTRPLRSEFLEIWRAQETFHLTRLFHSLDERLRARTAGSAER